MYNLAKQVDEISQNGEKKIVEDVAVLIATVQKILNDHSANEMVTLSDGSKVSKRMISRQKLRSILNELRKLERDTSKIIYDNVVDTVELGLLATVSFYTKEFSDITKTGKLTAKSYVDKLAEDGLTIKDRSEIQATRYTDDIIKRVRVSINKGDTFIETMDEVIAVFDGKEWELRRIVTTETFNSYRQKVGEIATENGYEWIRIHESFPRHPRRKFHECYKYAHENNYGKGNGVFKATDEKIYSPHIQCTSWLQLIGEETPKGSVDEIYEEEE